MQLCGSLSILWHCLSFKLEWKLTFSSPVATAEFSKFAGILSVALSQHHLRIWNSSTGILSPPLALFIVILPKAHWLHIPGCLALDEWITPSWLSQLWRSLLYSSSVYSCHLFLISWYSNWRRDYQTTSVFLPWERHEQYEKAKKQNTKRWIPQVSRCSICYWRSVEK